MVSSGVVGVGQPTLASVVHNRGAKLSLATAVLNRAEHTNGMPCTHVLAPGLCFGGIA